MQKSFIHSTNASIVHCASILSHSCKNVVYIIEQNKDFDPNRAYILVNGIRVKIRENRR